MLPTSGNDRDNTRGWTSRSLGSRLQHEFFYRLIRLGGRRLAYLFLYPVVGWYTLCRPSARRRTEYYLRRRFPAADRLELLRHSYRLSLAFARVLVDRARIGIEGPHSLKVTFPDRNAMLEIMAGGGFVLMNAHVGCWQVAMSAIDFLQTPVNMLLQREHGDVDRQYYEHRGERQPFRIIEPGGYLGGVLEMLAVLKRREALCVMGDRILGSERNVLRVPFLGREARFPYSAYALASAAQTPVAVLLTRKTGPDSYTLQLARVIRPEPGLGREPAAYYPCVLAFAQALEVYVREYPYQFFNFHDLWA